jgi:hypothetical protein
MNKVNTITPEPVNSGDKMYQIEVTKSLVVTTNASSYEEACQVLEGSSIPFEHARSVMRMVSVNQVDPEADLKLCEQLASRLLKVSEKMAKDLSGIAASKAFSVLAQNWSAAIGDRNLSQSAMRGDLLEVIGLLQTYREAMFCKSDSLNKSIANAERSLGCFDLPDFDSLSPDETEPWLMYVRQSSSEMGPREALRLARQAYYEEDGQLPATAGEAE